MPAIGANIGRTALVRVALVRETTRPVMLVLQDGWFRVQWLRVRGLYDRSNK